MKTLVAVPLGALLLAAILPEHAVGDAKSGGVHWRTIIGIEQAGNIVGGITGGAQPWSTLGGQANVDLVNNKVEFDVRGLVLAGGNSIGTPDGVTQVEGTLVCAPSGTPKIINTPPVTLSPKGNAEFSGSFTSSAAGCSPTDVAFLIRILASGLWIANGAVRVP
jgi:hypothetical protein